MRLKSVAVLVLTTVLLTSCEKTPVTDIRVKPSEGAPVEITVDKMAQTQTAYFAYATPATKRLVMLEDFLKNYLTQTQNKAKVAYLYNFADLNQDGENEILVSLLINGAATGDLRLVVASDYKTLIGELPCKGPLVVTNQRRGDWSILATYGGDGVYKTAVFSDKRYQWLQMSKENVIQYTEISGTAYLSDEELFAGFPIM